MFEAFRVSMVLDGYEFVSKGNDHANSGPGISRGELAQTSGY